MPFMKIDLSAPKIEQNNRRNCKLNAIKYVLLFTMNGMKWKHFKWIRLRLPVANEERNGEIVQFFNFGTSFEMVCVINFQLVEHLFDAKSILKCSSKIVSIKSTKKVSDCLKMLIIIIIINIIRFVCNSYSLLIYSKENGQTSLMYVHRSLSTRTQKIFPPTESNTKLA